MVHIPAGSPIYRLAGRYVAYWDADGTAESGGRTYSVAVHDLKRARVPYAVAAWGDRGSVYDDGIVPATITDIVLKPNRSVAWIACRTTRAHETRCRRPARRQLWRVDRRQDRLLDRGRRIRPRSLRRRGSTISWRHGKARRTASLK